MLSKHKVSKPQTIMGIALCTVISVIALTKAPSSIAQSGLIKKEAISLEFKQIPLASVVQIIANFSEISVFNKDLIDKSFVISIKQSNEPANKVLKRALQCGGYDYIEYESGIELTQSPSFSSAGNVNCVVNEDGSVVVTADEITAKLEGGAVIARQATIDIQ